MAGRKITIEFLGKSAGADKTAAAVEQRFGKLGTRLDRVGQRAGQVLAVGFLAAGAAAIKMGNAAADDEAAQSKLANTLRNTTGATKGQVAATERWITMLGKTVGISDDQLRPALSKLVVATGDVAKAQQLAALAMDISAGTGKDLGAVSQALAKAQNGNVAGLARLGVKTKDVDGKTLSLKKITQDLTDTYNGAAAAAADTTAGRQRKLAVQFGELQEQIGTKLLPVMAQLAAVGLKVVDWISRNTTTAGVLAGVLVTTVTVLWATSVAMRAVATATALWAGITKVAAAGQWLLNAALTANPIGLIVVGIAALVAGLVLAYKKSDTFRAIIQALGAVGSAALGWIVTKARDLGAWIGKLGPAFNVAKTIAVTAFKAYLTPIQKVVDLVKKLIDWISKIHFPSVPKAITNLGGKIKGLAGFASGTSFAPGGAAVVGERGPEIVNLPRGSQVIPNHKIGSISSGGSSRPLVVQLVVEGKVLTQVLLKEKRTLGRDLGLA